MQKVVSRRGVHSSHMICASIRHVLPILVALACLPALAHGLEYEPLDAWVWVVDILSQPIDGKGMLIFTTHVTNTGSEPVSVGINSLGWNNGSFTPNACDAASGTGLAPGRTERVVGCFPDEYDLEPILIMISGRSEGLLPAHILPFVSGACSRAAPANTSCQPEQSISHLERGSMVRATVGVTADSPQGPVPKYAYYNPDHLVVVFDRPILLGNGWERNIVLSTYGHGTTMQTWSGEWDENQILASVMISRIPDYIESTLVDSSTISMSVTVGNGTLVDAEGNPNEWAVIPVATPDTWAVSGSTSDMQDDPSDTIPPAVREAYVEGSTSDMQDDPSDAPAGSAADAQTAHDTEDGQAAQWEQFLLDLINEERLDADLGPVTLGNNPAAQAHADSMLSNCFSSHWGLDGLKPYMRYSLAGGYQYNAENVSGLSYCIKPWENYVKTSLERDIRDAMAGFMDSPGHRDNILNPHHSRVSLGLAWDDYNMMMVQHFEHGYVSFAEPPAIRGYILSLSGTALNGAGFRSADDLLIQVYHDPPPHDLSVGQVIRTYCYDSGRVVAALVPPPPPGSFYIEDSYQLTTTACPDPYDMAANAPIATSPEHAHDIWYQSYVASSSTAVHHRVPYHEATEWTISGDDFTVRADIRSILERHGPGVYTIAVWGVMGGQNIPIGEYSVFYGIDPPL